MNMIGNYFKIARRNLWRNKTFSAINIFGLALGIAACFFVFEYVYFENSYDRLSANAADIYRVPISYSGSMADIPTTATNHPALGPAMKADFPEVVDYVRIVSVSLFMNASTMSYTEGRAEPKTFNEGNIFVADKSFFRMFNYPLIAGDPQTCLAGKNDIAISEGTAARYFGKINPIGKILKLNGELPLKVTAVYKKMPENSHIKFDMLISFETVGHEWGFQEWTYPEFYNYVQLAPGTDPGKVEAKFPAFIEKYLGAKMKELNFCCSFSMQPLTDIHLKSNYLREAEANGSQKEVYFLGIIGVFILLIAWINYINLSTAKSMERAKEVGLRKVVGAFKKQLIGQFLFESLIINLLSLLVAVVFIVLFSSFFDDFVGKQISRDFFSTGLGSEPGFWTVALLVFIAGALLVGAYPAFVLSSFLPVKVLKGLMVQSRSGISMRRVLVSFQFTLSIILIACTFVVVKQFNYMRNGNLGYDKDQLLIVKAPVVRDTTIFSKYRFFKSEIGNIPSIGVTTATSDIPGNMIRYRNTIRRANHGIDKNFTSYLMEIDEQFIPSYKIRIVAGRNFENADSSDMGTNTNTRVLVNEEVVKALGYPDAAAAVNQDIKLKLGQNELPCRVIGVVKNFHQRSMKEKYDPILFYFPTRTEWKYISVNVRQGEFAQTLAEIENLYKKVFTGNPFEYFFLDDYFNKQYQADQRLGNVFGLFAVLAILVACMGLVGLSSFVIRLRTKEIGIRKVLGATVGGLLVLISKDFVKLVMLASLLAVPVVYFTAKTWLDNYAFHIGLGVSIFLVPPLLLLGLTLLTISLQSVKAALSNPVKSLKSE